MTAYAGLSCLGLAVSPPSYLHLSATQPGCQPCHTAAVRRPHGAAGRREPRAHCWHLLACWPHPPGPCTPCQTPPHPPGSQSCRTRGTRPVPPASPGRAPGPCALRHSSRQARRRVRSAGRCLPPAGTKVRALASREGRSEWQRPGANGCLLFYGPQTGYCSCSTAVKYMVQGSIYGAREVSPDGGGGVGLDVLHSRQRAGGRAPNCSSRRRESTRRHARLRGRDQGRPASAAPWGPGSR